MTSKEALGYLEDIAMGRNMNLDPYELTQIVKRDLEVLEILFKYADKNFECFDFSIYDLEYDERLKIKEWFERKNNDGGKING